MLNQISTRQKKQQNIQMPSELQQVKSMCKQRDAVEHKGRRRYVRQYDNGLQKQGPHCAARAAKAGLTYRLAFRVRLLIISAALVLALSMAVIRLDCSLVAFSIAPAKSIPAWQNKQRCKRGRWERRMQRGGGGRVRVRDGRSHQGFKSNA